jgi:hypothetical protein
MSGTVILKYDLPGLPGLPGLGLPVLDTAPMQKWIEV